MWTPVGTLSILSPATSAGYVGPRCCMFGVTGSAMRGAGELRLAGESKLGIGESVSERLTGIIGVTGLMVSSVCIGGGGGSTLSDLTAESTVPIGGPRVRC